MSGLFADDQAWETVWRPRARMIVGYHAVAPATDVLDRQQATDLFMLKAANYMIACRVRRPKYFPRYGDQFTIRSRRDSGQETEWAKVFNQGFGDWLFYAFAADLVGKRFARWCIIRLDLLREWQSCHSVPADVSNGDGTYFKPYTVPTLYDWNPAIVVGSSNDFRLEAVA